MIEDTSINIQSKIKMNGLLSKSFTLIQEFHQGCPLSVLLCIIAAEVLTIFIDIDTRIKVFSEKNMYNFYKIFFFRK